MINMHNVHFSYPKSPPLFEGLDFELSAGSIYGLLGRNGAGKTTLLKLIAGLLYADRGEVTTFGYTAAERAPDMLSSLYFIPEDLYVPPITIEAFVWAYAPFYPKFSREQFDRYREVFDLPDRRKMSNYSYGQKKKTLLCFGLATNTSLLILDEPTNGLDIPSKAKFRQLLAGAATEERTVIISTHQVRDMANLIDPIIILDEGKVIFQSSLEEITRALRFELIPSLAEPENAIYSERVPGGHYAILQNQTASETEPDIEVLFNAVISNPQRINELLQAIHLPH